MLVLSRKTNELLHIGDDIVIKVLWTTRGRVRLGWSEPRGTRSTHSEITVESSQPGPRLQPCDSIQVTHSLLPAGIPVGTALENEGLPLSFAYVRRVAVMIDDKDDVQYA